MIKKYFNDGLLQLAILLSLLRTDLNNYLNLQLHNSHSEIHEIILGPTSAYTQTNFHSHHWNSDIGFSHPKNVENIGVGPLSILEELHSLGGFAPSIPQDTTSIAAWLVNHPSPVHPAQGNNDDQDDSTENVSQPPPNPPDGGEENPMEEESSLDETEGVSQADAETSSPSGELTREDMDLIEVLWRQDMDLGVSREVFDTSLRRELEKEKAHAQKKLEPEQSSAAQKKEEASENAYIVDSETGELTPAPPGASGPNVVYLMSTDLQQQEQQTAAETEESLSSLEEAMRLLEQQVTQGPSSQSHAAATSIAPPPMSLIDQQYQALLDSTQSNGLTAGQNTQVYPAAQQQPQLLRQNSLEQTLQEMADLFASTDQSMPELNPHTYPIVSTANNSFDDTNTPLLQNTTMVPPADYMNLTQPLTMPTWEDLLDLDGMQVDPLGLEPNTMATDESLPFDAALPPLDTEQLFDNFADLQPDAASSACNLNLSGATFQPVDNDDVNAQLWADLSGIQGVSPETLEAHGITRPADATNSTPGPFKTESSPSTASRSSVASDHGYFSSGGGFLDQLMNQDDAFEEMDFSDEDVKPQRVADDASSDSAVSSMGSIASPNHASYQDLNDSASTFSDQLSVFDGVEGATGGYEDLPGKPEPKLQRYRDFHYQRSRMDSSTNHSEGDGPSFTLANKKHVNHNHTYPLQPGQKPRERKTDKKQELKVPMTRDARRAKDLKVPFTVEEIIHSTVERFNEMMQQGGLTEAQLQLIRDIRRRGKNKVAAQNCRKRKLDTISNLDDEVLGLRNDRDRMSRRVENMNKEMEDVQNKMGQLYSEIFRSLRDDSGRPYDPDQYLLEQNDDGDVFLVPRNTTEGRPRKAGKKHKGKRSK